MKLTRQHLKETPVHRMSGEVEYGRIKTTHKNLTFILLLASVLELLLPNKSMRGFVQLIMGLFVISAVLTPMTDLIKVKLPNQIPAFADQSASDLPVLAAGGEDKNVGESAVNEQYKKFLSDRSKHWPKKMRFSSIKWKLNWKRIMTGHPIQK